MEDSKQLQSFEQLRVWQVSQDWALQIYTAPRSFPRDELFGLTSQLCRAASSVSENIAEGFGRSSAKDKLHFYVMAYSSALETKNHLYLAYKLGYIDKQVLEQSIEQGTSVQKLLNAFMKPLE